MHTVHVRGSMTLTNSLSRTDRTAACVLTITESLLCGRAAEMRLMCGRVAAVKWLHIVADDSLTDTVHRPADNSQAVSCQGHANVISRSAGQRPASRPASARQQSGRVDWSDGRSTCCNALHVSRWLPAAAADHLPGQR